MANIFTPKYIQIQEYLADRIEAGELRLGDKIPSENRLSDQFGVSRMTVRQALTTLVSEGRLKRVQGLGTFVAQPKVEYEIDFLVSFTQSALRKSIEPTGKLLELGKIDADERLARVLQLRLGQQVYRMVRVRFGNNVPVVLERCYFPCHRCPDVEKHNLQDRSLYQIWKDEYGISFGRVRQTLEPVAANEFEAQALDVPLGSPLMLVERVTFDTAGEPVEYAKDVYRGDRSRFVSESIIGE